MDPHRAPVAPVPGHRRHEALGISLVFETFEKIGLKDRVLLIGVGEPVSVPLFLIPWPHSPGLLLLSGNMGGTIATPMEHGEPFVAQSIYLLVVWITGYLRYPEVLQSFRQGRGKAKVSDN